ncbi:hypothetical protein C465_02226 [Halorubrum distributum JCM 9100]|uniref:Uncharacterized protein n=2 Tax=Halorubrum distributum TaxID=29283 RepID=M0EWR2_9EURY|nr:hypothetical protein C465_02226 [Halorubrum distributum JCM 9100]ELZ58971.1 hypothetical protein C466_00180 [Halorubrum distributum JCM 10118]
MGFLFLPHYLLWCLWMTLGFHGIQKIMSHMLTRMSSVKPSHMMELFFVLKLIQKTQSGTLHLGIAVNIHYS